MAMASPVSSPRGPSTGFGFGRRDSNGENQSISKSKRLSISSDGTKIDHWERQQELQLNFKVKIDRKPSSPRVPVKYDPASLQDKINIHELPPLPVSSSTPPPTVPAAPSPTAAALAPAVPPPTSTGTAVPPTFHVTASVTTTTSAPPAIPQQQSRHNSPSPPQLSSSRSASSDDLSVGAELEDATVLELKEMLRKRGLPATGKKSALLERLRTPTNKQRITPLDVPTAATVAANSSPKMKASSAIPNSSPRYQPYPSSPRGSELSPRLFEHLSLNSPRQHMDNSSNFSVPSNLGAAPVIDHGSIYDPPNAMLESTRLMAQLQATAMREEMGRVDKSYGPSYGSLGDAGYSGNPSRMLKQQQQQQIHQQVQQQSLSQPSETLMMEGKEPYYVSMVPQPNVTIPSHPPVYQNAHAFVPKVQPSMPIEVEAFLPTIDPMYGDTMLNIAGSNVTSPVETLNLSSPYETTSHSVGIMPHAADQDPFIGSGPMLFSSYLTQAESPLDYDAPKNEDMKNYFGPSY